MKNPTAVVDSGLVQRYHSCPEVPGQLLAHHQWGVAVILLSLVPLPSRDLLMVALLHDAPESHTGDMPAPLKNSDKGFKEALDELEDIWWRENIGAVSALTEEERNLLKLADCLEGAIYCIRQYSLGNQGAFKIYLRWRGYIEERFTHGFLIKYKALGFLQLFWEHYTGQNQHVS